MAHPLALRGEIDDGAAIDLLRDLEGRRVTGTLTFRARKSGETGSIELYGGEIAVEQPSATEGCDPVERFLEAGALEYQVQVRLPPLAVAQGSDQLKRGSLRVHVPADLMAYCERAGLTGVLKLSHEDRRAEAIYENGELLAIALDGRDDADLQQIFAWEEGVYTLSYYYHGK